MKNKVSILARQNHTQDEVLGWDMKEESGKNRRGCSIEKMEQMTEMRNYKSQEIRVFLALKGDDLTLSYILCFSVLLYPFNQASFHLKSE